MSYTYTHTQIYIYIHIHIYVFVCLNIYERSISRTLVIHNTRGVYNAIMGWMIGLDELRERHRMDCVSCLMQHAVAEAHLACPGSTKPRSQSLYAEVMLN